MAQTIQVAEAQLPLLADSLFNAFTNHENAEGLQNIIILYFGKPTYLRVLALVVEKAEKEDKYINLDIPKYIL